MAYPQTSSTCLLGDECCAFDTTCCVQGKECCLGGVGCIDSNACFLCAEEINLGTCTCDELTGCPAGQKKCRDVDTGAPAVGADGSGCCPPGEECVWFNNECYCEGSV